MNGGTKGGGSNFKRKGTRNGYIIDKVREENRFTSS